MPEQKDQDLDFSISARIDAEMNDAVNAFCKANYINRTYFVREAIALRLKQRYMLPEDYKVPV